MCGWTPGYFTPALWRPKNALVALRTLCTQWASPFKSPNSEPNFVYYIYRNPINYPFWHEVKRVLLTNKQEVLLGLKRSPLFY